MCEVVIKIGNLSYTIEFSINITISNGNCNNKLKFKLYLKNFITIDFCTPCSETSVLFYTRSNVKLLCVTCRSIDGNHRYCSQK